MVWQAHALYIFCSIIDINKGTRSLLENLPVSCYKSIYGRIRFSIICCNIDNKLRVFLTVLKPFYTLLQCIINIYLTLEKLLWLRPCAVNNTNNKTWIAMSIVERRVQAFTWNDSLLSETSPKGHVNITWS